MVRVRPVVAVSSALVLLAGAVSGPVLALGGDPLEAPASGSATSTLKLLDVAVGGTRLDVLELALRSERSAGVPTTSISVTPLTVDGTAYARQSVGNRRAALPPADSARLAPAAAAALASARTPAVDVVSEGATSRAGATSLGSVSLLGIPLALDGRVDIASTVDDAGATGSKTLTVTGLALPSVADLLAARGLDLRSLPTGTLTELLRRLRLETPTTRAADSALQAALAAVAEQAAAAQAAVAGATAAVTDADAARRAAEAAVGPAATALNDATAALGGASASTVAAAGDVVASLLDPGLVDEADVVVDTVEPVLDDALGTVTAPPPVLEAPAPTLPPVVLPVPQLPAVPDADLQPLVDAYLAAKTAYDDTVAAVSDAQAVLATAQQVLADAKAALDAVLVPVTAQLDALLDAATGVLDATPLVALDRLEVTTRSSVTSARAGGQTAEVVGGRVEGLRVLGTDVLDAALGTSGADVARLTGAATAEVDAVVAEVTGDLAAVLSAVPGLPGLVVPAPSVTLLKSATATDVADGYGLAGTALRALTVSWPGLTVPRTAAVPGADALPGVTGLVPDVLRSNAVGDVVSQPLTLGIATLEDRARFRPAQVNAAPGPTDGGTAPDSPDAPVEGAPDGPRPGAPGGATPDMPETTGPGTGDPGAAPVQPRATPVALTQLPRTGADSTPAAVALLLVGAALALHRRTRTT